MRNLTADDQIEIIDILCEGLTTDGGHHKQWYLEQILNKIADPEEIEGMKEEFGWEPGIPA